MAHLFLVLLARERWYQQENLGLQMQNYLYTGVCMLPFFRGGSCTWICICGHRLFKG